jgi:hypothetical protein
MLQIALTCLAILLMVIGLVVPQALLRLRRWRALRLMLPLPAIAVTFSKPPDLSALSISRT